jgi:hypothetical protein
MVLLSSIDSTLDGIFNVLRNEYPSEEDTAGSFEQDPCDCECCSEEGSEDLVQGMDIPNSLTAIIVMNYAQRICELEALLSLEKRGKFAR